jgi:hypothetical protein
MTAQPNPIRRESGSPTPPMTHAEAAEALATAYELLDGIALRAKAESPVTAYQDAE